MAELIIPSDRVRELTSAPRRMPIEVEGSVAFEVVLTIWSALNPEKTNSALDLGKAWQRAVIDSIAPDLREELEKLGGPHCFVWLGVASLMLSAPHPYEPEKVYGWLASVDERRLRRWIVGYAAPDNVDSSLIEQVVNGDVAALPEVLGEKMNNEAVVEFIEWLLETPELPGRYASAIERFREEVFSDYEPEFAGAISRAAAARRAAPMRGDAKSVIEDVTAGLDFEIPLGITRVVLIPSMVCRPLSLIDGHRDTLVVYYGVADEFVDSDPEAPPSWLVRTYKALSDDKRLRIMRRLGEGPATLDQLSDMLGLSKSTVHHHINLLRGAGLVRVHLPAAESKTKHNYSIRAQSLADANAFLDSYLRSSEQEAQHV